MAKNKFSLTTELLKVEPEPLIDIKTPKPQKKEKVKSVSISLKISEELKKEFQVWCVRKGKSMTEELEEALKIHIQKDPL
jgi:hypothetical protein